MTIPPFPSQDLAKLVLGYLAEEQLMTAYDEFLQASPYLDALGNEYDRIFMTSLKNILAEYRAVKIYVETCKPFVLRKKIFQCANLLEMVKFLIQNVDVNKLQMQENNNLSKNSKEKQSSTSSVLGNACDVCNSLKLDRCACKERSHLSNVSSNAHISTSSKENSVETTPLSDLPGNHVTCRKKNVRTINKDLSEASVAIELNDSSSKLSINSDVIQKTNSSNENLSQMNMCPDTFQNIGISEKPDLLEMRQKEEFNSILNQVCNKNKHVDKNFTLKVEDKSTKVSIRGYNDFATGVNNGLSGASISVPDSSTSETLHVQVPTAKETNNTINLENNPKVTQTKTQYLLKVANVKSNIAIQPNEVVTISTMNKCNLPRLKPKSEENKIKILSDIKVDKPFDSNEALSTNMSKMPQVLKNATSTPLLQMQTIVINGTPVYRHKPFGQKHNYTKDEIMAMPTIIIAPAPGSSQTSESQAEEKGHSSSSNNFLKNPTHTTARQLGPLIIDVAPSRSSYVQNVTNENIKEQNLPLVEKKIEEIHQNDDSVAKTVDITSASAPKDSTVTAATETSTPQGFPPLRKSSSTPRRTSHVRVLDFTTPRRILQETINKCVPCTALDSDKEVVISKSPANVPTPLCVDKDIEKNKLNEDNSGKLKSVKKVTKNWDADLRVLATVPERDVCSDISPSPKPRPKPKSVRKSKAQTKISDKIETDKVSSKKKTPKVRLPKNKSSEEEIEVITIPDDKIDVPVKPTINIISGVDRTSNTSTEMNKSQNKSNNEDNVDTPEMERMSLQNEIGVKLNISDLLETPYKQALYDIQMETPRFLGPDIPDDPMSDIKIMNIPTPRFLSNAATPSSYSSRPTDYSSGGSYYKPEEQDYMRIHDDLDCPVTSTKESTAINLVSSDDIKEKENMKPTRPVRECTKNVSYNLANMSTRTKGIENRADLDSSVDSVSCSNTEKVSNASITPKIKDSRTKCDTSKKSTAKKRKTPVKREVVKSFMKIKPRRPTPTKTNTRGKRKSIDPTALSKVKTRKKSNKEESVSTTPVINSAPTKSRRKSSTPRKLHCSKSFHSESSGHDSPELVPKTKEVTQPNLVTVQDSDNEQLPLRWSDDGSQEPQPVIISIPNETDDIKKIKEYIETTVVTKQRAEKEEVSLHIDLVKRGFDIETAKSIERDLLDTPPHPRQDVALKEIVNITTTNETDKIVLAESKLNEVVLDKTLESDCSNNLQIVQNDDEEVDEDIELSVHECNEESTNYFSYNHDDSENVPKTEPTKLKEKFCMEVCIDDGVSIRLRATPFSLLLDQEPTQEQTVEFFNYSYRETEMAVTSISNFDKLYTPLKESIKAQCYEIFDSTLTSLDTPLKAVSPKQTKAEVSVAEIILEVEKVEEKDKVDTKKRKRAQSGNVSDESITEVKRAKPEAQLLFNSTNIHNFDIDSVLSKLHGP